MQAIKKIEEHTLALTQSNALVDEAEALGEALADNTDKLTQLLKEFKLVRDNLSEVQSLAQHLVTDNDVHMASLHFQQASAPLLARMAALTQNASPKKAPLASTYSVAPGDRPTASSTTDKTSKKVSLSGWLRKRGKGTLSNSHRRYFILDQSAPTQLRYFETDSLQKQKGYIPLDRMEAVLINDADTTMFGIDTGDRVWSLQADTEHDARIWVKALSKWGESFQRLQLRQHILNKEAAEASASAANDISPRPQESSSAAANALEPTAAIDESLHKMQLEAEKREMLRQQDSSRRWKEKQELRFQREAARLKEEAASRYLSSSESQDLASPTSSGSGNGGNSGNNTGGTSTPSKSPRLGGSFSGREGTPHSTPTPSIQYHHHHDHSGSSGDDGSPTPTPSIKFDNDAVHHDTAALKEKLKEALKLKRERNITLTDLLHQRQLFLSLKAEKHAEIAKLEDSDASIVELRAERDEAKQLSKQLVNSITTYQQQLLEQDKLIGLIQGSVRQNEEKATHLQADLEQARAELENLEPPFATVSFSLSAIAVQRMLAQIETKDKMQVEHKLEMLSEAHQAHGDLALQARHAFDERERKLQAQIQDHQVEMDDLSRALDTTRHKFQYLRTLLNTDAGYSILEELEDLKHDYFVTIVNGIKLNLIQEGHTLKITSPTSLYTQAKSEGVAQSDWPNWISTYIHSKCIESYPPDKRLLRADDDGEQQRFAVASDPHLNDRNASRSRSRRRQIQFGASFGGNIGGGGLMMM